MSNTIFDIIARNRLNGGGGSGGSGVNVLASETEPAVAKEGDLWTKDSTNTVYIRTRDGASFSWVKIYTEYEDYGTIV